MSQFLSRHGPSLCFEGALSPRCAKTSTVRCASTHRPESLSQRRYLDNPSRSFSSVKRRRCMSGDFCGAARSTTPKICIRSVSTDTQAQDAFPPPDLAPAEFSINRTVSRNDVRNTKVDMDSSIRQRLRQWQKEHGEEKSDDLAQIFGNLDKDPASNTSGRMSGPEQVYNPDNQEDDLLEGMDSLATMQELDALDPHHRVLRPGDLVELPQMESTRDPIIGVYIRKLGAAAALSQFFTAKGKWVHTPESSVQYVVPAYIESELIDRIIPHLPSIASKDLQEQGTLYDLSVPREVSGPIVTRLISFTRQSQELYRENASRLDQAHEVLAHDQDLKFGTLSLMTRRLLGKSTDDALTPIDMFTVRLALLRAGFAFGFDERHHRLTGFVHIRSKAQVRMVAKVRNWLRQYRDELADHKSGTNVLEFRFQSTGGRIIQRFIKKARDVIAESRRDREPTTLGTLGPSKVRLTITRTKTSSVRYVKGIAWDDDEREIIRFLEAWSSVGAFARHPSIDSQPSLLLHATGMYDGYELNAGLGFLLLQELGVLLPYENRARYDEKLLIPSSQHSRPLEQLMTRLQKQSLESMNLKDTMKDLRHDWGDLPVFCIDKMGSHEIDDGISIELESDASWVHVHIANPTAYLDKESPLAKMARHMTETIYMPERAYTMLPSWVSQGRFSLGKDRASLTFSAKIDKQGTLVDYRVTPGFVRNVHFIDPGEIDKLLGNPNLAGEARELIVGGKAPPSKPSKQHTKARDLSPRMEMMLRQLFKVATQRYTTRSAQSGISLNTLDYDVNIWVNSAKTGLPWDGPSRNSVRRVEGDPIIQYCGAGFSGEIDISGRMDTNAMVREYMLLACEIGAKWCEDRDVPVVYRGSLPILGATRESSGQYYQRVLEPKMKENDGKVPFHLLNAYLEVSKPSTLALQPQFHEQLGMTHFTKVTSPLRRYGDMVNHWQIEAALREEAKRKQSLKDVKGQDILPFSRTNLQQMMTTLRAREDRIKRAKKWGLTFWTQMLLFRAHYFGETDLPKRFVVYVSQSARDELAPAVMKQYGLPCLVHIPEGSDVHIGDEWEAEWQHISPYRGRSLVTPIQLVKRAVEL